MKHFWLLCIFWIVSCTASSTPTNIAQAMRGDATSANVNLNIMNRTATINPLTSNSDLLFSANVENRDYVVFEVVRGEQTSIVLGDNPQNTSGDPWQIETSVDIPVAYIVDVNNATFTANLTTVNLPRFDLVANNSTIDIAFPSGIFQLAVDASDSMLTMSIPTNATIQSGRWVSDGGILSIDVSSGVGFAAQLAVVSGGVTLNVPATTGVQIMVDEATNAEITLPGMSRQPADTGLYATGNYEQADAHINLTVSLENSTIRILQE